MVQQVVLQQELVELEVVKLEAEEPLALVVIKLLKLLVVLMLVEVEPLRQQQLVEEPELAALKELE